MRNFAIILDENGISRVIPSKWLVKDRKSMYWPPFETTNEVTEAVIHQKDVGKGWTLYHITKYIKSSDSYTDAVRESKLHGIENLTDPSDEEKLKRSRSERHKKHAKSSPQEPLKKKPKTVLDEDSDESSDNDDDGVKKGENQNDFETSSVESDDDKPDDPPIDPLMLPPKTLNVTVQLEKVRPKGVVSAKGLEKSEKPNANNNEGLPNSETVTPKSSKKNDNPLANGKSVDRKSNDPSTSKSEVEKNARSTTPESDKLPTKKSGMAKNSQSDDQENDPPLPDISHLTDHEIIIATHHMVFKLMNKVNRLKRQNETLKKKIEGGYRSTQPTDKQLSLAETAAINKYFPVDTKEAHSDKKIEVVEKMLGKKDQEFFKNVVIFFRSKGGSDCRKLIFNIMTAAMSNGVADQYSFTGRKAPRKAFNNLRLCACIYQAAKLGFPNADDDTIKDGISSWLDTANTRLKREANGQGSKRAAFQPIQFDDSNSGEESD